MLSKTPETVAIRPRHPSFELDRALATDWHGGDVFKTAFFNTLSLTFPVGESYFIDSVRAFQRDVTDPKLSREIRGFIGQEAIHRREHRGYNDALAEARGYAVATFEAGLQARIDARAEALPIQRLMETVAFEHLTAVLAHGLLTDDAWLAGADPDMTELWRWHAIEEAEHKAVTFDVYRAVGGDMTRVRQALPYVTRQLLDDLRRGIWMMLRADGEHLNPAVWARGINWLAGTTGVMRRLAPEWRDFLRPDFHPWDHDNRDVIERWRATREPSLLAA